MLGTEKQIQFAEAIMQAIEATDVPEYDDSRPRGRISIDRHTVRGDKAAVALWRAVEDGADRDTLNRMWADIDAESGMQKAAPRAIDREAMAVQAGTVIDLLKKRYYTMYGPEGRLSK